VALGSEPVGLIAGASRRRRNDRFLLLAILLSVAFHLLLALLWLLGAPRFARLHLFPTPQPTEQFVTISSAVRIEHRAVPQPQARRAARPPAPRPVPKRERIAVQKAEMPIRVRHELAAVKPAAHPAPPESTSPPQPTPKPAQRRSTPAPRKVAQIAEAQVEPPKQSALSSEKLAQLDQEFERAIAQAKSAGNPLNVKPEPPAATKRYRTQMVGVDGRLSGFEGLCDPIKSWEAEGWDYYFVACNVAFDDGRLERQGVPWPVRFRPEADPFAGTGARNVPLAGPLPGWRPGPNDVIAPELRRYFHDRGVDF
jgi:hypothetical protein